MKTVRHEIGKLVLSLTLAVAALLLPSSLAHAGNGYGGGQRSQHDHFGEVCVDSIGFEIQQARSLVMLGDNQPLLLQHSECFAQGSKPDAKPFGESNLRQPRSWFKAASQN